MRTVSFTASPGGPVLPAFDAPDATPLGAAAPRPASNASRCCRRRAVGVGCRHAKRRGVDPRRPARRACRRPLIAPDRASGGRGAWRRPCPDPGPRQDADGRVPRGHARDAAPRGRAGHRRERLAHARDPGARGGGARGRVDVAARPRRPGGAARRRGVDRADRRLDADRRGPSRVRGAAGAGGRPRAWARPRTRARGRPRARPPPSARSRPGRRRARARGRPRALARRSAPQPRAAGRIDDQLAQLVRARARGWTRARPRARS